MSRLLFLGASPFQLAPIRYANAAGHYVITTDNKLDNPGHKMADESHTVSTLDADEILKLAKHRKVDGIVAFASDPAAPVAAYVATELGLPCNSCASVLTMTYKDLWRKFQRDNGFRYPASHYSSPPFPYIVKPIDSSGSKGVSIVRSLDDVEDAFINAYAYSRRKIILWEPLVPKDGYQIAGDGFVVNGELVFHCFANEHFEGDGIVPVGESFPYIGETNRVVEEVQRAINLLGFNNGSINFDIRISNGRIYLMEMGARAGGNLITEAIKYATGVNLAEYVVKAALGEDCSDLMQVSCKKNIATYMIHSNKAGRFRGLEIDNLEGKILHQELFIKDGDLVTEFTGSNHTLGTMIIEFSSLESMTTQMDTMSERVRVCLGS